MIDADGGGSRPRRYFMPCWRSNDSRRGKQMGRYVQAVVMLLMLGAMPDAGLQDAAAFARAASAYDRTADIQPVAARWRMARTCRRS